MKSSIPTDIHKIIIQFVSKFIIMGIGRNEYGQLSIYDSLNESKPLTLTTWTKLYLLQKTTASPDAIFANFESIFIINHKNELFASGYNEDDRLGLINQSVTDSVPQLTNIKLLKINDDKIKIVSKGIYNYHHTFICTQTDLLFASGYNPWNQFPCDTKANYLTQIRQFWNKSESLVDIQCGLKHSLFLTNQGNVYQSGGNVPKSQVKLIMSGVKMIAVGERHNVLLICDGTINVMTATKASYYQLCNPDYQGHVMSFFSDNNIQIDQIWSGLQHCVVLSTNNQCFAFGANDQGQCASECLESNVKSPRLLSINHGNYGNDWIENVSCGYEHNLALTNMNEIYSWGNNEYFQCTHLQTVGIISKPHLIDQRLELGLSVNEERKYFVERVIALTNESIIILNGCSL